MRWPSRPPRFFFNAIRELLASSVYVDVVVSIDVVAVADVDDLV